MSTRTKRTDPAYVLLRQGLLNPEMRSVKTVHRDGCYICEDPEFSLMGLPLCTPCKKCEGHVPADDSTCDACGWNQND